MIPNVPISVAFFCTSIVAGLNSTLPVSLASPTSMKRPSIARR